MNVAEFYSTRVLDEKYDPIRLRELYFLATELEQEKKLSPLDKEFFNIVKDLEETYQPQEIASVWNSPFEGSSTGTIVYHFDFTSLKSLDFSLEKLYRNAGDTNISALRIFNDPSDRKRTFLVKIKSPENVLLWRNKTNDRERSSWTDLAQSTSSALVYLEELESWLNLDKSTVALVLGLSRSTPHAWVARGSKPRPLTISNIIGFHSMVKLSISLLGSKKTLEYFYSGNPSILDELKSAKDENVRQNLFLQMRRDLIPTKKVIQNSALAITREDFEERIGFDERKK